jgi:amino acid transporter
MAEEVKNPDRDLPIGIIGSLIISLALYVSVSAILTLIVPYNLIEEASPLATAFANHGLNWMEVVISVGAFAALITTIFNSLLGQSRISFVMSRDGLLFPFMSTIHPKYKTPYIAQIITGALSVTLALFIDIDTLAEMVRGVCSSFFF